MCNTNAGFWTSYSSIRPGLSTLGRRDTCLYVLIPPLHAALHTELSRKEGNVELLFKTLHCSEDTEQNSSPRTS